VFTGDSGIASISLVSVIEEACHILGQHLMVVVVLDEVVPRAIDTFAAEQGAGGEVVEDLANDIVREAGQCTPLVGGLLHFICVQ
jgi:hypothetical protein